MMMPMMISRPPTAVVADAGSHVIATAADNEQQDYENEYERHAGV